MLDQLANRLQAITSALDWDLKDRLTEADVDAACREVRRALLEADVNLRAITSFLVRVKEQAVGERVLDAISPEQQFIGILSQELTLLLGQEAHPLNLTGDPAILVFFGLQGSGKTTTVAKLGLKLRQDGKAPLLVAADTIRPAAIEQLKQLGRQNDLPVFDLPGETDMLAIAEAALVQAKAAGNDIVLIDTAGRLQIDTAVMADLLILERALQPQERLLVIDAMMGQEAVAVAEAFDTQLNLTGLILTKLDGDARGGAILSVVEATGKPIKWIGTGEKPDALEPFHPDRMATRILGMGDVQTLIERAKDSFEPQTQQDWIGKIRQDQFTFVDFMQMQNSFLKLGSFDQILGMLPIPGLDKSARQKASSEGEKVFKQARVIIDSMTAAERNTPSLLTPSRMARIAHGAGLRLRDVEAFLEKFNQMRGQMKQMADMMAMFTGDSPPTVDPDLEELTDDWGFPLEQATLVEKPTRSLMMPGKRKKKPSDKAFNPADLLSAKPRWPF